MSDNGFSEPRRQELLGVIILFGENLRRLFRLVAALLFASIYAKNLAISGTMIFSIGALLMAIYTVFQYLRFKFHIEGDELIIQRGVLVRERLTIPLERIQTVNLSQNVIQQLLKLTGVKIDTAGSGKEELKISALKRTDALELQSVLGREIKQARAGEGEPSDSPEEFSSERNVTLVSLNIPKLLLVGLTENHIRSGLVALGVVWGYFWQFEDMIGDYVYSNMDIDPDQFDEAVSLTSFGLIAIIYILIVFLIASMLISMIRTVLRHFDLKAILGQRSLNVTSGLLKKNSYTIPLNKIQMVTWKGNFLRKIPGFESVLIRQSKSGNDERNLNVEIPACYKGQREQLEGVLFSHEMRGQAFTYSPHPFYRVYLTVIFSLIGLAFFGQAALLIKDMRVWFGLLIYLPVVILWVRKYTGTVTLTTNGDLIQFSKGWLFTSRRQLKAYKIQSMKFRQSIFQKRRGTGHLKLFTAGGVLSMRFMPYPLVEELYNYLLYKVELSDKNWM